MAPKPEQINSGGELIQMPAASAMPVEFATKLQELGVEPSNISVPRVPHYWKTSWAELCTLRTRDPKVMVSPLCVVVSMSEMPEAEAEFKSYQGMVRLEFVTEDMRELFVTHSMCYSDTGEYLPLTEWVRGQRVPFVVRFGYIETRKSERHVVKPMPANIDILT